MRWAIEATGLHRSFTIRTGWWRPRRRTVEAVRGVDLAVPPGELFGLLGPNGAGKTTMIKMLTTLLLPTRGRARIHGLDVVADAAAVRARIGFVFGGDRGLYDRLSALDNLRYFAELYGVEPRAQAARIGELLELVGLAGRERERVEGFSRGMKQRLHIARGLLHEPDVLFLDEPTIGLDAVAARELRRTVAGLVSTGRTVLLTTHYMFEADELCDRIGIINDGRIVALDTPERLKARASDQLVVDVVVRDLTPAALDGVRALSGVEFCSAQQRGGEHLLAVQAASGTDLDTLRPRLLRVLASEQLLRFETRQATLEDAYVAIVDAVADELAVPAAVRR